VLAFSTETSSKKFHEVYLGRIFVKSVLAYYSEILSKKIQLKNVLAYYTEKLSKNLKARPRFILFCIKNFR